MSKRVSSAAMHAAHILFRHYTFRVRGPEEVRLNRYDNLQATEVHVAIFLDYKTNAAKLVLLRPKISYWQEVMSTGVNDARTAKQIAYFLKEVLTELEHVPHYSEEEQPRNVSTECVTTAGAWTVRMGLTKAALDAMETLYYYYALTPKKQAAFPNEAVERIKVAKLLDSCLCIGKALKALPMLRAGYKMLLQGQASPEDIVRCLIRLGILFEFMPNYEDHRDEVKLLTP